jgi:hypothetical protein
LRSLLVAFVLAAALPATAQVLYKLIDREGRVTYTDKEPKGFDGRVIRIEPDTDSNVLPSAKPAERATRPSAAPEGIAEGRRKAREDLGRKLRAAEARVEAARKALAEDGEPRPDEMQTVQRRYPPLQSGQNPPRPNCFSSVDPNGKPSLVCPQQVPQEGYYERRRQLEEALRLAEEELAAAEQAYRRGTD